MQFSVVLLPVRWSPLTMFNFDPWLLWSAWFAPKVATWRGVCWREKWSSFYENSTDASITYLSHQGIYEARVIVANLNNSRLLYNGHPQTCRYSIKVVCIESWFEYITIFESWWAENEPLGKTLYFNVVSCFSALAFGSFPACTL